MWKGADLFLVVLQGTVRLVDRHYMETDPSLLEDKHGHRQSYWKMDCQGCLSGSELPITESA